MLLHLYPASLRSEFHYLLAHTEDQLQTINTIKRLQTCGKRIRGPQYKAASSEKAKFTPAINEHFESAISQQATRSWPVS